MKFDQLVNEVEKDGPLEASVLASDQSPRGDPIDRVYDVLDAATIFVEDGIGGYGESVWRDTQDGRRLIQSVNSLKAIMDRASAEVATWPSWKMSPDIRAELEKLRGTPKEPSDACVVNVLMGKIAGLETELSQTREQCRWELEAMRRRLTPQGST